MTPRALLLLESRATGGVTTIGGGLTRELRSLGWDVCELVYRGTSPPALWAAARSSQVVLASHNFAPAYLGWLLSLATRKPLVVWVHGPVLDVLAVARASRLKRFCLAWLYRRLPLCVFVSQESKDSFERFTRKSPRTQTRLVVPNAIPQADERPSRCADQGQTVDLGYVGRLSAEKRPLLLIDALRLLPERFRLTLVGDGPLRHQVVDAGADLMREGRLILAGEQRIDASVYRRWHLTLLASEYEGCPLTLLESLSAGVPCVALPIPAVREVLRDDASCLLADGMSAEALARSIQHVAQLAPDDLDMAMSRVLERHRMIDFALRWDSILREATAPC